EDCRAQHRAGLALEAVQRLRPEVRRGLRRCLAVEVNERYGTWDEVETELETVYAQVTGQPAPVKPSPAETTRDDRVAGGWSLNAIGHSYSDIGKFEVAARYFERVRRIGKEERDRALEGAGLGNQGNAYQNLGEVRRAIDYFEQHLAIAREIGDRAGQAVA